MPTYVLPQFNITVNIWREATPPPAAPDLVTMAQLRWPGRGAMAEAEAGFPAYWFPPWTLLLPPRTDVRSDWQGSRDYVEAPAGTGRLYRVIYVDDVARNFPNEYRIAYIYLVDPTPAPLP